MSSPWSLVGVVGFALALSLYVVLRPPALDQQIIGALKKIDQVVSYTQSVQTSYEMGDRRLLVEGTYGIDSKYDVYTAFSTTTLYLPGGSDSENPVFTVANVVVKDDVYTRVDTKSDTFTPTVPHSPKWHHFKKGSIPPEFVDISAEGPVLDNLILLRNGGAHVSLIHKPGPSLEPSTGIREYVFTLSPLALEAHGGTLGALASRLSSNGRIYVYVDSDTLDVSQIVLSRNPYFSTTTIEALNIPVDVHVPGPREMID